MKEGGVFNIYLFCIFAAIKYNCKNEDIYWIRSCGC